MDKGWGSSPISRSLVFLIRKRGTRVPASQGLGAETCSRVTDLGGVLGAWPHFFCVLEGGTPRQLGSPSLICFPSGSVGIEE